MSNSRVNQLDCKAREMAFSLDDFEVIKEFRGNKLSMVSLVEHRISKKKLVLKRVAIVNLERQSHEIKIHKNLDHKFIIKLIDHFVGDDFIYLLIEFAKHGDLYSHLPKLREKGEEAILKVFFKIVQAVNYLHENGFVHRDIKPENVLLTSKQLPKLADFGSSSCLKLLGNTFCGTFEYMAPEICLQSEQSYKVDVWALGILLYEMLNGSTPFRRDTIGSIKHKLEEKKLEFKQGVSAHMAAMVYKFLRFVPEQRPNLNEIIEDPLFDSLRDRPSCVPENANLPSDSHEQQIKVAAPTVASSFSPMQKLLGKSPLKTFHTKKHNSSTSLCKSSSSVNKGAHRKLSQLFTEEKSQNSGMQNLSIFLSKAERIGDLKRNPHPNFLVKKHKNSILLHEMLSHFKPKEQVAPMRKGRGSLKIDARSLNGLFHHKDRSEQIDTLPSNDPLASRLSNLRSPARVGSTNFDFCPPLTSEKKISSSRSKNELKKFMALESPAKIFGSKSKNEIRKFIVLDSPSKNFGSRSKNEIKKISGVDSPIKLFGTRSKNDLKKLPVIESPVKRHEAKLIFNTQNKKGAEKPKITPRQKEILAPYVQKSFDNHKVSGLKEFSKRLKCQMEQKESRDINSYKLF